MKNKFIVVLFAAIVFFPLMAQAQLVGLASDPTLAFAVTPLSCFDFNTTLQMGSKSYAVRGLQYALIREGFTVSPLEYGTFGSYTLDAVKQFQTKYGLTADGVVGKMSNANFNSIYGCGATVYSDGCTSTTAFSATTGLVCTKNKKSSIIPANVSLSVKSVILDGNGATGTFCNNSPTDIPSFPVRLRLNGIIRDFDAIGALKAGSCDTETLPYSTWGLTYDPNVTFGLVTGLDPNGIYKTSQLNYPAGTTTLAIRAVTGAHLSVRGLSLKSNGVQATLCNLGTSDIPTYPVHVTVNGTSQDFDVTAAHTHGQCPVVLWTYDKFGLPALPASGTAITATVNVDPNITYKEINEFDNSATVNGSL